MFDLFLDTKIVLICLVIFYVLICTMLFYTYIHLIRRDYDITYKILGFAFLCSFIPVYNVYVGLKKLKMYYDNNLKDKVILEKYKKIEQELPFIKIDSSIYTTIDLEELEKLSQL